MTKIAVAFCLVAASALAGAELDDTIRKSVPVQPGGNLRLTTEWGSIDVQPGDVKELQLEVIRKVDAPDRAESERILRDFDLEITQTGADVAIRGFFKTGWKPQNAMSSWGRRACNDGRCLEYARYLRTHQYKVTVPRKFNVDLQTRGGSVHVGDLDGAAKSSTSGGSLHFGKITGAIYGRTSGGSVTLDGGSGPADIRTSGGSIRIGDVSGSVQAHTSGGSIEIASSKGNVVAKTSGGNVRVRGATGEVDAFTSGGSVEAVLLAQPQQSCRLSTSGGNVTVHLADAVRVDLDAHTSGGRIETEFPVTVQGKISKTELKAAINGGGPLLHLRTSGGSIYVKKGASTVARAR